METGPQRSKRESALRSVTGSVNGGRIVGAPPLSTAGWGEAGRAGIRQTVRLAKAGRLVTPTASRKVKSGSQPMTPQRRSTMVAGVSGRTATWSPVAYTGAPARWQGDIKGGPTDLLSGPCRLTSEADLVCGAELAGRREKCQ